MALIGMREVCWGFGDPLLLEKVTFQIAKGERVCLLGRNGVGKSTMLKLLAGEILPDSGDIWCQQGATVAVLDQDVPTGFDGTIFDVVAEGLGPEGKALAGYNRICRQLETVNTHKFVKRRDELQNRLNSGGGWELLRQVESVLSRTLLDPEKKSQTFQRA